MKQKIIVVGSSNTDMVVKVPHIPAPGETVLGGEFMTIPGGKGANQAVAASRAGGNVTFIACISNDSFGEEAIRNYKKDNIDTTFIKMKKGGHSGIALINVAEDGENSISVAPGANSHLLPEDIYACKDVFKGAKVILAQLEIPLETVQAVADVALSEGVPFILNPAPGAALPESLLKKVSVITPNETEAAILTSRKKFSDDEVPEMAVELLSKGIDTVLITLGSKGVYLKNNDFDGIISGYKVKVVDTTAAGDVFNGALAAALATKMLVGEAVDFAQRAAAISVTRMGAQPSAPQYNEIKEYNF